jgi:hypothetical protein
MKKPIAKTQRTILNRRFSKRERTFSDAIEGKEDFLLRKNTIRGTTTKRSSNGNLTRFIKLV